MSYNPPNPNGQATSANSQPIVIASDQSPVNHVITSSATALAAGIKANLTAYGNLRVSPEGKQLFVDPFDGSVVDVANRWIQSGTVVQSASSVQVGNVLTLSTVNSLTSQPSFPPLGTNVLTLGFVMSLEANSLSTTNVNRFVGFGVHSGTPSTALPITDGVGFEWDSIGGKLWGAVYVNGVRSGSSVDLTASVTSSNTRYVIQFRSDLVIFYITGTEIPVGTVSFVTPYVQVLPLKIQTVIGGSTPSTTPLNSVGAVAVADSGGNSTQLSDGTFQWRKNKIDIVGNLSTFSIGPGETVVPFAINTGAASVTDGTNGKTVTIMEGRESDVYLSIAAISTSPAIQVEGTTDNINFTVIPLTRIDNTAVSQQYSSQAAFVPVANAVYKGKSYGYSSIRVHLTAGTISNTTGVLRVVPMPLERGSAIVPFGLTAANTTESVGSANGQISTGGVRTLTISSKGSNKAILVVDGSSGTTGTNTIVLEGSYDNAIWMTLPLQTLSGGPTATSKAFTSGAAIPSTGVYESDVSKFSYVRVRAFGVMTTSPFMFGGLKIINIPISVGLSNSVQPTNCVSVTGLTPTVSTNIIVIEAGANNPTFIKRMIISPGQATASGLATLTLSRNTIAASAAGTATTGTTMQRDTTDAVFSGVVRTGAFTVVGITTVASQVVIPIPTPATTLAPMNPVIYDFTNGGTEKGLLIPIGTTNGAMFTHSGLTGATGFGLLVEFTE